MFLFCFVFLSCAVRRCGEPTGRRLGHRQAANNSANGSVRVALQVSRSGERGLLHRGHRGRLVHLSTSNYEAYDVENVADITIDIDEAP